jgi:methyl-accepting chemotaxis protein/hemerythrin
MGFIDWTESLSVGIPVIDAQHKTLIERINRLEEARGRADGRKKLGDIVRELDAYAKEHFALEEGLFVEFAYPDAKPHKAEHAAFVAKIAEFELAFAIGKAEVDEELLLFLRSWLTQHIAYTDKKYRPWLRQASASPR